MAPKDIVIWYINDRGVETKYVYGSGPVPQNQFVQNTVKTIDHLINKKAFDNFVVYGSIKIDGNFLKKVISDKNRSLNVLPLPEVLDKSKFNSTYKQGGYVPNSDFKNFEPDGSYGSIRFNDEYGIEFEKNGKTFTNSPAAAFGHEFTHTIHGTYSDETNSIYHSGRGNGQNKIEEMNTITDANQVNSALGEEPRIDHNGTNVKVQNPTSNKKSN